MLSAGGGATVLASHPTEGALAALLGGAVATFNSTFEFGDREADQIKKCAELLELAELFDALELRIEGLDPDAQHAEYAELVRRVAEVRGRSRQKQGT